MTVRNGKEVRQDNDGWMNEVPQSYEDEILRKLDKIILIIKENQARSQDYKQVLKEIQKSQKVIVDELHKIRVNAS